MMFIICNRSCHNKQIIHKKSFSSKIYFEDKDYISCRRGKRKKKSGGGVEEKKKKGKRG